MSINLKLIDRAPALASHPHVFVILGGDAVAEIDYSINPAQRTATAVTDRHFGVQFEADRTSVSSGGSVADVMSKINPGFVRFPGGYHTESRFDITQPNGPGLRESLTGFLNNAAASGQKTIMVLPTHCFFDGNGLRPGAEEAVRNFVTSLLSGGYGPADTSPTLAAIAKAHVDDGVTLERRGGKWMLLDMQGCVIGRMAGSWGPPEKTHLVSGRIGAIVRWRKSDNEEAYQSHIKREEWETVLPEFVFRSSNL